MSVSESHFANDLTQKLSQQEKEMKVLKDLISELEATKEALSHQLVSLNATNFQMCAFLSSFFLRRSNEIKIGRSLEHQFKELKKRYDAAVEVIAEKSQLIADLQNDLEDVKAVFKKQIQNLCAK